MNRFFITDDMPAFMRIILLWLQGQPVLTALLVLMFADMISGAAAACIRKKLSSSISFQGAVKKGLALLMVGVGVVLEPFAGGLPLSKLTCLFFLYHETLSIIENMGEAGMPIPPAVLETLAKLRMETNKSVTAGINTTTVKFETMDSAPMGVSVVPNPPIPAPLASVPDSAAPVVIVSTGKR